VKGRTELQETFHVQNQDWGGVLEGALCKGIQDPEKTNVRMKGTASRECKPMKALEGGVQNPLGGRHQGLGLLPGLAKRKTQTRKGFLRADERVNRDRPFVTGLTRVG